MRIVGAVGLMDIPATKELCNLAAQLFTSVSVSNKVCFSYPPLSSLNALLFRLLHQVFVTIMYRIIL